MIGRSAPWQATYGAGLDGLVAGDTRIAKIDGTTGRLWYRGYAIEDLAHQASFEEVAYLLVHGELPDARERAGWSARLLAHRAIPRAVLDAVADLDPDDPAALLRTAMCIAAAHATPDESGTSEEQVARILSWSSGLAAAAIRRSLGEPLVPPREDLDHAHHFLWLVQGATTSPAAARAFEVSLIVQAEHGLHAAALAALVVASAGATLDDAVVAGMCALNGPLHGGANRTAFDMVNDRSSVEDARRWALVRIAERYRFPGFGHRVYKSHDPRARVLEAPTRDLLEAIGEGELWGRFEVLREEVERALGSKGLYANIDAVTGLLYHALGLPREAFTIPFCLAIEVGWMAHCLEYLPDGPVVRPRSRYIGALADDAAR